MEWMRAWMMSIAGTVVFGVICEMLLPSGNMKKYVRIVLGMLLVFTVAKPFASFRAEDAPDLGLPVHKSQAYAAHAEMEEQQKVLVMQVYSDNLKENVNQSVQQIYGEPTNSDVTLKISEDKKTFGEIQSVSVSVAAPNREQREFADKVRKQLAQEYDVAEKDVQVKFTSDKGEAGR